MEEHDDAVILTLRRTQSGPGGQSVRGVFRAGPIDLKPRVYTAAEAQRHTGVAYFDQIEKKKITHLTQVP